MIRFALALLLAVSSCTPAASLPQPAGLCDEIIATCDEAIARLKDEVKLAKKQRDDAIGEAAKAYDSQGLPWYVWALVGAAVGAGAAATLHQ